MRSFKTKLMTATAALAVMSLAPALAASDILKTTPLNNNYNNAGNWVGGNIPGSGNTATFNNVNADGTNLSPIYFTKFSVGTTAGTFIFNAPGTKHIVLLDSGLNLTFTGGSGVLVGSVPTLPAFDIASGSVLTFNNGTASGTPSATQRVSYSVSGDIIFNTGTNAGNADLQVGAGTGSATFNGTASATTALILNNNTISFNGTSTAASSAITNNATLNFNNNSTAGSSTIANNSFLNLNDAATLGGATVTMGAGATVDFDDTSEGGTARIILNNSGAETVDFSGLTDTDITIGSIEGGTSADLIILDSAAKLRIGNNNFSATGGVVTLNAIISSGGAAVALEKIGSGELILGSGNTFTGGVDISGGKLTIGADNRLGVGANNVGFYGGTLRTTNTFTTNRTFTLNAGGGTFETDTGTQLVITTAIGEAGGARALTKTGNGDVILTDASTYTGGTNINAGRILLGNGGTTGSLSSTGTISIASGAFLGFQRTNAITVSNNIVGQGGVQNFQAGPVTLSGTNTYSGNTEIYSGRLIAAGGSGVGDASNVYVEGPGVFEITSNETIGGLGGEGGGLVELNANTLTLGGGSGSGIDYIGDIAGTGNIVKNGTFTQDFFFGGTASFTGDTTVNAGLLRIDGGVNGNVIVNSGGNLGGEFFVGGNLTNNGGNVTPGYSPGTIVVNGDYIGVGAPTYTVDILTQNQNVNNPGFGGNQDLLDVSGDYVGANTQLILNPTGTPVATTGNGIEIARVGGASQADDFFLSTATQTAANGFYDGFQYVVNYVPGATDRFYLQTQVREELVANATALAASRQLTRDCFRGSVAPAAGGKGSDGRGWLNVKVGSFNSDASNGADFDTNYNCVNGGFDVPVGSNVSVGIRGGYANSDLDLNVAQGLAQMDATTWNVEAAVTYVQGGFYAGLTGGWTAHDWDYDHALASGNSSSETFDGFTSSLFAGYRVGAGKDSSLTFEGLVSYDGTDCDANCFLLGTQEDISEWEGRLLGRYDTKIGGVMPYLQVSLSHDFGDGQSAFFGNAISNVDIASLLMGANVGVSANLGGNWFGTFDLGTTQGLDSDVDGYHGSIGVKTTW